MLLHAAKMLLRLESVNHVLNWRSLARIESLLLSVIICVAVACPAQSRDTRSTQGIHLELMPYLIVPGMSGNATVRGTQQTINASAGDIFSHLQFGFMARSRVNYKRGFLGTDTVYMGLGGANSAVDAGFDTWGAELLTGYRVHKQIALFGGARYNSLSANLKFKGPLGANPRGAPVWWDPFFGGEGTVPFTKTLNLSARLDVGGFGAGSRIAVNSEPLLNYQFSERYKATIGWKFLYQDYVNNSKAFEYDFLTQGPVIGMTIRW